MPHGFTVLGRSFHLLFHPVTNPTYIWTVAKAPPGVLVGRGKMSRGAVTGAYFLTACDKDLGETLVELLRPSGR